MSNFRTDVRNYMKDAVANVLVSTLKSINSCTCENCLADVYAIALNELPTKYVSTARGELFTKVNNLARQYDIDILSAITKASVLVSRNPRH